jgi:hypothetical protein
MALNFFNDKGVAVENQQFTWRELTPHPLSKLDDDAFCRIRITLIYALKLHTLSFSHFLARTQVKWQGPLARLRTLEQHQATLLSGLMGADFSTTQKALVYEQSSIEITASMAKLERSEQFKSTYCSHLLEGLDHLYRLSALTDHLEGMDANWILQNYTPITPSTPTSHQHQRAEDVLKRPHHENPIHLKSEFFIHGLLSLSELTHQFYLHQGSTYSDPTARGLMAEISSVKEQQITSYESLLSPQISLAERWPIFKAMSAYFCHSCLISESHPYLKTLWQRFLDYDLGQLQLVLEIFKITQKRDPAQLLEENSPAPLPFGPQREFIGHLLASKSNKLTPPSLESAHYRDQLNSEGSPSETINSTEEAL